MNTDAAEALQALCPMTPLEARCIFDGTGQLPAGWEIVKLKLPLAQPDNAREWIYANGKLDNWDIIRRKQ